MINFKNGFARPKAALAMVAILASTTAGGAQTLLTPPPLPADETTTDVQSATPPPPPAPATPPPPPPAEMFFVSTDGSSEGPFGMSELETRMKAGTFTAATYVWQDGMTDWLPAGDVGKLDALLASAQAMPANDAFDIDTFLVGIWSDKNTSFVPGLGQVQLDVDFEYYSDGRMDGIGKFTANQNGQQSVYDVYYEGTWSLGPNSFRDVVENHTYTRLR